MKLKLNIIATILSTAMVSTTSAWARDLEGTSFPTAAPPSNEEPIPPTGGLEVNVLSTEMRCSDDGIYTSEDCVDHCWKMSDAPTTDWSSRNGCGCYGMNKEELYTCRTTTDSIPSPTPATAGGGGGGDNPASFPSPTPPTGGVEVNILSTEMRCSDEGIYSMDDCEDYCWSIDSPAFVKEAVWSSRNGCGCYGEDKEELYTCHATTDSIPSPSPTPPTAGGSEDEDGDKATTEIKVVFPLGECLGDCDNDNDCQGNLICYQRGPYDDVPGCDGGKTFQGRADFCIDPAWIPSPTPPTEQGGDLSVDQVGDLLVPSPTPAPATDANGSASLESCDELEPPVKTDDDCNAWCTQLTQEAVGRNWEGSMSGPRNAITECTCTIFSASSDGLAADHITCTRDRGVEDPVSTLEGDLLVPSPTPPTDQGGDLSVDQVGDLLVPSPTPATDGGDNGPLKCSDDSIYTSEDCFDHCWSIDYASAKAKGANWSSRDGCSCYGEDKEELYMCEIAELL